MMNAWNVAVAQIKFFKRALPARLILQGQVLLVVLVMGCSGDKPNRTKQAGARGSESERLVTTVTPRLEVKVVASQLLTPAGIAIQPGTGHLFVSTTDGVVRITPENSFQVSTEIDGFGVDSYGSGPEYEFGPLGLAFLDQQTLVVGGGGEDDGKDLVRFYSVGNSARNEAMSAASATATVGPIGRSRQSLRGEGNFFALAVCDSKIYVTSHGDDTKGWINTIKTQAGSPGKLTPWVSSKKVTGVDGPTGVALNPEGQLLIAQCGELHEVPDSVLAIFDRHSGDLKRSFETDLRDITAIAYHPVSGDLLALDFAWAEPERGGLFLIEIHSDHIRCQRLVALRHPTSIAIAADGTIYVTAISGSDHDGQVLQIVPAAGLSWSRRASGQ